MFQHIILQIIQAHHHSFTPLETKKFLPNQVISIGRSSKNDIHHISHPIISARHGAIYYINDTLYYEDFSKNGTTLQRKGRNTEIHNTRIQLFQEDILKIVDKKVNMGLVILVKDVKED